jgi:lysozyme
VSLEPKAVELIKEFEGLKLKPYLCSAGVPTIGYGSTFYLDGKKVTLQDPPITQQKANELLNNTLQKVFIPGVLRACPVLIAHPYKLGAIVSFAYNLGVGRLQASTLRRRINEQNWEAAANELLKWNLNLGKPSKGLIRRREAEKALFLYI